MSYIFNGIRCLGYSLKNMINENNRLELLNRGSVMTTPRGIRNNNPGNIRAGTYKFSGQVGMDEKGFRIFKTPKDGINALESLLKRYQDQGINTTRKIINKYAPSIENDTQSYAEFVATSLEVHEDQELDLNKDTHLLIGLCKAIIKMENGIQPYPDELF